MRGISLPGCRSTSLLGILLVLLILFGQIQARSSSGRETKPSDVEIAFLEDWCKSYSRGREAETIYEPRVRLAFRLTKDGWKAFGTQVSGSDELKQAAKRFSGDRKWILLEGERPLDSLISHGITAYQWYSDVGIQEIVGSLPASALLPRGIKFSGWDGCEVRRPIVLVNSKPQKGNDNWKTDEASFPPNQEVIDMINKSATELYTCEDKRDENGVALKAEIRIDMLETVEKLKSNKGDRLIAIRFRKDACVADNTGDFESSIYWFVQKRNSSLRFVGRGLDFN